MEIFFKTISSFRHKQLWLYVFLSFILAVLAFFGIYEIVSNILEETQIFESGFWEWVVDFLIKAGSVIISLMFIPTAMLGIISLFESKVAEIIEEKEYSKLVNPTPLSTIAEFRLIARNLLINLLCTPLYLIPLVGFLIYYTVNAYLMGNTVYRFISARNVGSVKAKVLAKENSRKISFYGLLLVIMASIPFINLIAPIFAIVIMVHLHKKIDN